MADFVVRVVEVVSLVQRDWDAVVVLHEEVRWEVRGLLASLARWLLPGKLDLLAGAPFFDQAGAKSSISDRLRLLPKMRWFARHEVGLLDLQWKVVIGLGVSMLHDLVLDLHLLLDFLFRHQVLDIAFLLFLGLQLLYQDLIEEFFDLLGGQLLEVVLEEGWLELDEQRGDLLCMG